MVDMGQADRSLYAQPTSQRHRMDWTIALNLAANSMEFEHYMDVPETEVERLKALAKSIQETQEAASER